MEKTKYKKLGIDIDGVLADFTSEMLRILRDRIGVDLPEDYMQSDWGWTSAHLPPDAMRKAWQIIDNEIPNFWETVKPMADIVAMAEFFHDHADVDHEVYFITARREGIGRPARLQCQRWLYDQLGEPKQPINVLVVNSGMDKVEVCYALNIDAMIDDHTPTIANNKSIRGHRAYLLDRPWNQDGKFYNLKIVKTLNEFFEEERKYK